MNNKHNIPCPIQWNNIPKWAHYVSVDYDGHIYATDIEPTYIDILGVWNHAMFSKVKNLGVTSVPKNSGQSLWQRPHNVKPNTMTSEIFWEQYYGGRKDFSNEDLSMVEFYSGTRFIQEMNFSDANFRGVTMDCITIRKSNLNGADFTGANLNLCNISRSDISNAIFKDATAFGLDIYRCKSKKTIFENANLVEADFRFATIVSAEMMGVTLTNSMMGDSKLINTNLADADLSESDLDCAEWTNVNLSNATLTDVVFNDTKFINVDLTAAIINRMDLSGLSFHDLRPKGKQKRSKVKIIAEV